MENKEEEKKKEKKEEKPKHTNEDFKAYAEKFKNALQDLSIETGIGVTPIYEERFREGNMTKIGTFEFYTIPDEQLEKIKKARQKIVTA